MIYLGVDPGASGAVAAIHGSDGPITVQTLHNLSLQDVWECVEGFLTDLNYPSGNGGKIVAVIEKVGGFIQGNPAPGSAMFNFGAGYGGLRMALVAAAIPYDEVVPQRWQRAVGVTPRDTRKGETKGAFKRRLRARAQQLFPGETITLDCADAVLIAHYCRLINKEKTNASETKGRVVLG